MKQKQLLRVDEVAAIFGVTRRTIYNWMDKGEIPFTKVGGTIFFLPSAIDGILLTPCQREQDLRENMQ